MDILAEYEKKSDLKNNKVRQLQTAVNIIPVSTDFPADKTQHSFIFTANDKIVMISYHLCTVGNVRSHEETLILQQWWDSSG